MSPLVSAPWFAVALPLVLAILTAAFGRYAKALVPWVAMIGPVVVLVVGVGSLVAIPGGGSLVRPWTSALASQGSMPWFRVGQTSIGLGWSVDTLSALMLLVVGVVALAVMLFSLGYMAGDRGWVRYYALLSLFTGAMTMLVVGSSFATLFVGWELVGACSYLLIGFWYEKPAAVAAAVKAFLATRVGDVGLLIGLGVLWKATGSLDYAAVMARLGSLAPATVTAAALLLALGAIGKSAQFPLHIWLPDAMEGPTPVSALIHAATMVAAGVFLIARTWPIFEAAPAARTLLLAVGVISALGAALVAVTQHDIKKVLAYSTISQLGLMFAALGVGAWEIAFFHLIAHAAFKALLFLAAGSVIHGSGTQDLRDMGGLRTRMPVTFVVWLVGAAALAGIPPLAGFFSKDAILDAVWTANPGASFFLFAMTLLTGVYAARSTKLAFFGTQRSEGEAHESALSMLVALVALAVPAAALGMAGAWIVALLGGHPEGLTVGVSAVAVALAVLGGWIGWRMGAGENEAVRAPGRSRAWTFVEGGFGFDGFVGRAVVMPTVAMCRTLWAVVDRFVIDGAVEGSAVAAGWLGGALSRLQNGDGQTYATVIALAAAVMLAAMAFLGR